MNFDTFFSDVLATVFGGACLALMFFVVKEKLSPIPDLGGTWYFEMHTKNTAYHPYSGMMLRYIVMLWRNGDQLLGTAEKVYEQSSNGTRTYSGVHRTRATVQGYIEHRVLDRDLVFLHLVERGDTRESTSFHRVELQSTGQMIGTFVSMVAEQNGVVVWQRGPF